MKTGPGAYDDRKLSYHADSLAPYSSMFSINLGFCTQRDRRDAQIRYHLQRLTKLGYEPDMHG